MHLSTFLRTYSFILFAAFLSYFVQFSGLHSDRGLTPVSCGRNDPIPFHLHDLSFFEPSNLFSWIFRNIPVSTSCEVRVYIVAFFGVTLSAVMSLGYLHHVVTMYIAVALYGHLVATGGEFMSFQWDILVLEVGLVAILASSPVPLSSSTIDGWGTPLALLRFVAFKLMFMSGMVKLQSECETWHNLTAVFYHYGSQCIPHYGGWLLNAVSPLWFHKFSVAMVLYIQIFCSVLLLVPVRVVAIVGAVLHTTVQLLIMATGNYNFFNMLSLILVWAAASPRSGNLCIRSKKVVGVVVVFVVCVVMYGFTQVYSIHIPEPLNRSLLHDKYVNIRLRWKLQTFNFYSSTYILPIATGLGVLCLCIAAIQDVIQMFTRFYRIIKQLVRRSEVL
eukprot:PhF_6_TR19920/c0_g1_i2/m.28966